MGVLGDYPVCVDGTRPAWQLLSLGKNATASSTLGSRYEPAKAFDEDIQTWWSASSNRSGEFLSVDLASLATLHAVQVNFADQGSTMLGRLRDGYRYFAETSADGETWERLQDLDRQQNTRDMPHDYVELVTPRKGVRFFRITNVCMPGGSLFSVSGLRLFGHSSSTP